MAMHKKDSEMQPYEVRGIDPSRKELTAQKLAEMMADPVIGNNIKRGMEVINRVEGKPRMIQQVMVKAHKEMSPITRGMTVHDRLYAAMRKKKVDEAIKRGQKK